MANPYRVIYRDCPDHFLFPSLAILDTVTLCLRFFCPRLYYKEENISLRIFFLLHPSTTPISSLISIFAYLRLPFFLSFNSIARDPIRLLLSLQLHHLPPYPHTSHHSKHKSKPSDTSISKSNQLYQSTGRSSPSWVNKSLTKLYPPTSLVHV